MKGTRDTRQLLHQNIKNKNGFRKHKDTEQFSEKLKDTILEPRSWYLII